MGDEDEYWQTTATKPSFDFDELVSSTSSGAPTVSNHSPGVKTLNAILAARNTSNEPFLKPSVIKCNHDKIEDLIKHLDDTVPQYHIPTPKQDPKAYIKDIVEKRLPIDFTPYKSKREKLLLLDCAICCSDGNLITAVTIFMHKTLKQSIFVDEMRRRQIAIDHFINYLELTGRSRDIKDLTRLLVAP